MTLFSLSEAIDWTRSRWDNQRCAPVRLHEAHTTEGELGAPRFSHGMAAALDGSPSAVASITGTQPCYHPLLNRGDSPRNCAECIGTGVKEYRSDRYLFPMSRALSRLANSLGPTRQPHPYRLVIELASHGWDPRNTASSTGIPWDRAEPLFLQALRKLHGHYAEGPIASRTYTAGWTTLSDSQRNAIQAGETAA